MFTLQFGTVSNQLLQYSNPIGILRPLVTCALSLKITAVVCCGTSATHIHSVYSCSRPKKSSKYDQFLRCRYVSTPLSRLHPYVPITPVFRGDQGCSLPAQTTSTTTRYLHHPPRDTPPSHIAIRPLLPSPFKHKSRGEHLMQRLIWLTLHQLASRVRPLLPPPRAIPP